MPVEVNLDAAGTYAGVVEFEESPDLASAAIVGVTCDHEVLVHDLFVMSYG